MSSLKKFHWHFKFPCKTIQSISSQTSLIVGEGFHISHEYFTSNLISKDRTQIRTHSKTSLGCLLTTLNIKTR